jgi:hypothetical protein
LRRFKKTISGYCPFKGKTYQAAGLYAKLRESLKREQQLLFLSSVLFQDQLFYYSIIQYRIIKHCLKKTF